MHNLGGENIRQIIQEEMSNSGNKKKSIVSKIGSVFGWGINSTSSRNSSSVLGEQPLKEKMIEKTYYLSDIQSCTGLRKGGIENGIRQYLLSSTYKYITGKSQRIYEGDEQKVKLVLRGYEGDIDKIEKDFLRTKDGHWTLTADRDTKEYVPLNDEIFQILPSATRNAVKSDDSPDRYDYKSVSSKSSSQK